VIEGPEDRPRFPKEWRSWDGWIKLIRANTQLRSSDVEGAVAGMEHLRRLFGDAWINNAFEQHHPLLSSLLNSARHAQLFVAGFGNDLALLEQHTSIRQLVARLKNPDEFDGAIAELSVTTKARRAGFSVRLPEAKSDRVADLLLVDLQVHIEIIALDTAKSQKEAMRTSQGILLATIDDEVVVGGRIHEILPESLLREYQAKIREIIQGVKTTGQPARLYEDRLLDLRFGLQRDQDTLKEMQETGYTGLGGPTLHASEMGRLASRLQEKVKRFPDVPDGSGIVVLYDSWVPVEAPPKLIAYHFRDILSQQRKVSVAALIYPSMVTGQQQGASPDIEHKEYGIVIHSIGIPGEEALIVRDKSRGLASDDDLIRIFTGTRK
jgi:hypothetical protein